MRIKNAPKPADPLNTSFPEAPAFQVYPKDELTDERILLLTNEQFGCYMKLWLNCWRLGSLPNDPGMLALMCHTTSQRMAKILPAILNYFKIDPKSPQRLIHPGLEKERRKQARFKQTKALAGRKGGLATQSKFASSTAKAELKQTDPTLLEAKSSSASASASASAPSPKSPHGEERESDAIEEPESRKLLRAEIGAIFQRPASRAWSKAELECLGALGEITPAEIQLLRRFYAANIEARKDRRRHNLESLLRNWAGEIDKANGYFTAQQRRDYAL